MCFRASAIGLMLSSLLFVAGWPPLATGQEDPAIASVRKSAEQLVTAFNAAKPDEVAAMFLPKGELIDEEGAIYQGPKEIKDLLSAFFAKFAGASLALNVESIRLVGPIAIEEGTRTITTKDGATKARFRYIALWAKSGSDWRLASTRDFTDEPVSTPNDYLQPIAGLVGDWVNEGVDAKVAISYRWSEDKNFLLGEFQVTSPDNPTTKSSQRIGWDPLTRKIRSWLFDADGGFAEGVWTVVDDEIVIKSSSVNPDGGTASATMTIVPTDKDHFSIKGTDRIVGDTAEPDFELIVTRPPPAAGK